jgi:hypothetical protein
MAGIPRSVRGILGGVFAATVVLMLPGADHAGAEPRPDRCTTSPGAQPRPCVGPVTDESGGGGDASTIAISVIVGLAVASVAFVLLRRQLARARPTSKPPPRTQGEA